MRRSAFVSMLALAALPGCGADTATVAAPGTDRPAGTIVVASDGNRLTAIDVATGQRTSRRVRSIPACGSELFVTGGHVVFTGVVKGLTTVFSMPVSLDRAPVRLGTTHALVPSATEGRVWLAGTDCDLPALTGVREVSVDGEVTFDSRRRVPGSWVAAATVDGLVVQRGRALYAWDPQTGRLGRRVGLDHAFDARGQMVAGCAADSDCDDLAIVDTATARTVRARSSGRHELDVAAEFSPDGSLLAAPARAGRRWSVAVVDARTGTPSIIPGSATGRTYPDLGWARSSHWLFIRDGSRVKAYRPGAPRAVTLPFRLPRSLLAFAAG